MCTIDDFVQKVFRTVIYPEAFKIAKIIPLHKSGSKLLMDNYRPIPLLPVISKLLEEMMFNRLTKFMVDTDQYYIKQFGFREKHSMVLAISELMGEIMKGFNNNFFKLAIFTDLRKAFDTVDHNILLGKLQFYGVDGIALTWFESYLNRRQQAVEIQNTKSQMELIDCSVPQGGVFSSTIVLIYC